MITEALRRMMEAAKRLEQSLGSITPQEEELLLQPAPMRSRSRGQ